MEKIKDLENLLKKFNQGALSNSEIVYLMNYFKDIKPDSEQEAMLQKILDESSDFNNNIDSEWIFNQVLNKVNSCRIRDQGQKAGPAVRRVKLVNIKKIWIPALRYAAVFILAFTLFWLIRPVPGGKESITNENLFQQFIVPFGSKAKVELPDGSAVTLNSGSRLRYASNEFLSGRRNVILDGEGFFEVKKDLSRPFYVHTPGIILKVLGTTFNVKAYPDENTIEMTLVTGLVEIYNGNDLKEAKKPILLKPNEKAVFNKTSKQLDRTENINEDKSAPPLVFKVLEIQDKAKTEQIISWKDDKLVFDNEPFSSLVIKLERWYDVQIKVDYADLNNARFTGTFDKETVEQVMTALSTITPFRFEINKNQITITKN